MTPEKTITLMGKEVGFKYNLATEIAFENIANKKLAEADLEDTAEFARLAFACIISYKNAHKLEDVPVTLDDIVNEFSAKDIILTVATVAYLRKSWYEVSTVDQEKIDDEEEEGDTPKN